MGEELLRDRAFIVDRVGHFLVDVEARRDIALHKIKLARRLSHYTIADACREYDESARAMYRVTHRCNPTINLMARMARVLGVELSWLLAGDMENVAWVRVPGEESRQEAA